MIQIKNLDDNHTKHALIILQYFKNIVDMSYSELYVRRIIPPAQRGTNQNSYFGPTYDTSGRERKVYNKRFCNSIVLYKNENIDDPLEENGDGTLIDKKVYSHDEVV